MMTAHSHTSSMEQGGVAPPRRCLQCFSWTPCKQLPTCKIRQLAWEGGDKSIKERPSLAREVCVALAVLVSHCTQTAESRTSTMTLKEKEKELLAELKRNQNTWTVRPRIRDVHRRAIYKEGGPRRACQDCCPSCSLRAGAVW